MHDFAASKVISCAIDVMSELYALCNVARRASFCCFILT